MKRVRCAIYTRKSSDEGLEQSFNSLDAQREACAAYILSQASEGWAEISTLYDDGGLSGGTLERPALQRLLAEVEAGNVDIVVVYKVDRLTRSLLDFAKLVEALDKGCTSFISITQSFNTTTSMGRLTLNMLLSFAQFEREVTAERIRDKIAASKAKGMWMGGIPPIGYKADGRTLATVEEHASLVRHLFTRYLALGSVRLLEEELIRHQISVPCRTIGNGKQIGGGLFARGQLYYLLKNVIYAGCIPHKEKVYLGLHNPIVERQLFDKVQANLASNVQGSRPLGPPASPSLLAGKLVDADGAPLIATHAAKGNTRYRYYVSQQLHQGRNSIGLRIPAREIESLVAERLADLFNDPLELATSAALDLPVHRLTELDARCRTIRATLLEHSSPTLPRFVGQVCVGETSVTIVCKTTAIADALDISAANAPATFELVAIARMTRSGRAIRLVHSNGAAPQQPVDQALLRLILRARRWWAVLRQGQISVTELAAREGVTPSYLSRVTRVAFLSPEIVREVLAGRQRVNTNVELLRHKRSVPASWQDQAILMLPS